MTKCPDNLAGYCAIHSRRVTMQPKDMGLFDTLRQLMGWPSYNEAARLGIMA